jgi:hypothetical protein
LPRIDIHHQGRFIKGFEIRAADAAELILQRAFIPSRIGSAA